MFILTKENLNLRKQEREFKRIRFGLPSYTILEEVLSAVTHGIGALLAIAAAILLPMADHHDVKTILCLTLYALTLFVLYIISTLYHALGICGAKKVFRVLDHCSIFLLIAGTYTPITMLVIGGTVGWSLFIFIWTIAIIGVVINSINLKKFEKISMACYLTMGWCVVFVFKPLLDSISSLQLWLLISGGVAYTVGAIIYLVGKKIKYMHSIWHVFVLAGSILQFLMIYNYIKVN